MKISLVALLVGGFLALTVQADELRLQDNAPTRYTVVKGDTLWGISAKFLKDPWKWPQIWGMNKAEIKNPHWIYPGDTVVLENQNGQPHLTLELGNELPTVKLSPMIHDEQIGNGGIPPIPATMIRAFATQPVVVDKETMKSMPEIVEYENAHIVVGAGDTVYATSDGSDIKKWEIVRPAEPVIDPVSKDVLGYSATYLGEARTVRAGNPQRVLIVSSINEIEDKDRLLPTQERDTFHYVPHAPGSPVSGQVISTLGIMTEAGRYNSIVINKGKRDGLDAGTVLAIYRNPRASMDYIYHESSPNDDVKLPSSRSALCMVYRVFDKLSYAIIMDSTHSVSAGDMVRNP